MIHPDCPTCNDLIAENERLDSMCAGLEAESNKIKDELLSVRMELAKAYDYLIDAEALITSLRNRRYVP